MIRIALGDRLMALCDTVEEAAELLYRLSDETPTWTCFPSRLQQAIAPDPEPTEEDNTPETVRDILSLVDRDIPLETVASWPMHHRRLAVDWASAVHLAASDNAGVTIPDEPSWVQDFRPDRADDGA